MMLAVNAGGLPVIKSCKDSNEPQKSVLLFPFIVTFDGVDVYVPFHFMH